MNFLFIVAVLFLNPTSSFINDEIVFTSNGDPYKTIKPENYFLHNIDYVFVDKHKMSSFIANLDEHLYEAPINASMNDLGQIKKEKPGRVVDREKANALFLRALYQQYSNVIEVPMRTIYPKVTSEIIAEISTHKMNEYHTFYKESNEERSHNIKLASKAINNYVVFPGEHFSFNKVVGERTKERGYMRAPVIVKGELSEDIGGGICQVSSTLYNAVMLKGIQIVERYSHSREVPYVPPGKDATVSWWGPDFVFKNNYREPIFIRASAKDGMMRVQIYSSDHFRESND